MLAQTPLAPLKDSSQSEDPGHDASLAPQGLDSPSPKTVADSAAPMMVSPTPKKLKEIPPPVSKGPMTAGHSAVKRSQGKWSEKYDNQLYKLATQRKQCNESRNDHKQTWSEIAEQLGGGFTADQCYERWCKVLDPELKKGAWTTEEDDLIKEGFKLYGELAQDKWSKIAEHVKTRNGKQVRERWINHLHPEICHDPWTLEEETSLIQLLLVHKLRWTDMIEKLPTPNGLHRPANAIKNRFNTAIKPIIGETQDANDASNKLRLARSGSREIWLSEDRRKKPKPLGDVDSASAKRAEADDASKASSIGSVVATTNPVLPVPTAEEEVETSTKSAPPFSESSVPKSQLAILVDRFGPRTNHDWLLVAALHQGELSSTECRERWLRSSQQDSGYQMQSAGAPSSAKPDDDAANWLLGLSIPRRA